MPIATFGAIQHKLANMATFAYVAEPMVYRSGAEVEKNQARLKEGGMSAQEAYLKGIEEYAIECSINKVLPSEFLATVSDEGVQVYGGMGYSGEAPMEAAYRDARISRIYEGTNEINRMLCVGMILKSAMKGGIDIMTPGMKLGAEVKAGAYDKMPEDKKLFADEHWMITKMKKAVIMVLGSAAMKYMKKLNDE